MENSSKRFFKGFSLEDYRLQVLVNRLERERKQFLNRLKEETHVFKMSVRLPVKCGEEYWGQYGENYHANGDKKEKGSVTHLSKEHIKEDPDSTNTAHHDSTSNSKLSTGIRTTVVLQSESPEHVLNKKVQRNSLQRIRSRSNSKNDSKKKAKTPGLTLLEILCADVEHGVLLLKKTGKQSESGLRNKSSLGHQSVKHFQSKKAHKKEIREKRLLFSDSDKSVKSEGDKGGNIISPPSKDGQSEVGDASSISRSKSNSFEVFNSDNSLKTSSISTWGVSSQESVPFQDGYAQNLSWTSGDSTNNFGLGNIGKRLQSSGGQSPESHSFAALRKRSIVSDNASKNGRSMTSNRVSVENSLEAQTLENQCRFVHFKDGCKLTRRKSRQQNSNKNNNQKEKFNRTKSSDVKLFQVDVPQTSQRRKLQEEIDKETRHKMDQFFAKVERTKNFQTSRPRWRCSSGSSGSERSARVLRERKTFLEPGKRPHVVKKEGYRRAQPWPTQVWS